MTDHHADGKTPRSPSLPRDLAKQLPVERTWVPDREAMLAALRVVLDLPAQLPSPAGGGER
jgi:hypothetical protein